MAKLELSIEFFPPKTENGINKMLSTAEAFLAYDPSFFSVTFGAGGSTQESTLDAVNLLTKNTSVPIAPHISCIGATKMRIIELLKLYKEANIKRLVALRGDLPSGMVSAGDFQYANELIEFIRAETANHFHIDVACYPEFHPQASDAQSDLFNFKRKLDAGANSAITQYFFNPDAYFHFVDSCQQIGIQSPIIPGIMPITNHKQLARFSDNCGAEIPRWIRKRLANCGDDNAAIVELGIDVVSELCQKLIDGGAPGLHFYSLNNAESTIAVLKKLNYE